MTAATATKDEKVHSVLYRVDPSQIKKKNINRMIRLITGKDGFFIGDQRVGFNMDQFYNRYASIDVNKHKCGSTACIAGFANLLAGGTPDSSLWGEEALVELFGITYDMAYAIAYPAQQSGSTVYVQYADIPSSRVAEQLKHLRDTGELIPLDFEGLNSHPISQ